MPTAKTVLHAQPADGAGYTLCGLAEDAAEDSKVTGVTEAVTFARQNQFVTCPACKRIIDHCQWNFTARTKVRFL